MTLRIMLLGLVASMGFELPSGADVSRWMDSSRNWVVATVADPSGRCVEAVPADVLPTDCCQAQESCHAPIVVEQPKSCDDKAFEAVSNAMAGEFAADLVVAAKASEPEAIDPIPAVAEVVETPAVGLPAGEEVPCLVVAETKAEVAEVAEVVAEEPSVEAVELNETRDAVHERLERISTAVRLTREAAQAWAEVIDEPADEAVATH